MILSLAAFAQLATACAAGVHVGTLAAIARAESGFHTLAIGDNTARRSHRPATREQAVALTTALLREGRSLDLGLMQINSANLGWLGLSVVDAFDPCRSLAAGARVLRDGYRNGPGEDPQAALIRALSHYNTGHPARGLANGYVARVQAAAEQVIPALRLRGEPAPPPPPPVVARLEDDDLDALPAWEMWARPSPPRPRPPAAPGEAAAAAAATAISPGPSEPPP